jgi:K+-sensing histidine kinase KdpD
MHRVKRLISANSIVNEIVRRIRNPLNALQLNIDNLEDEIGQANLETTKEPIKRMRNTIAELDSLLCEILRLSELPKPRITAIDVNALVRDVETFAKPESSKKALIVRINLQDNVPALHGDPIQIKQAVLNVLLNAIESSSSSRSITLATETRDGNISIKVGIEIEGHCDDRGSNEYNLALGAKRAESVKRYLIDLGISPNRLSTISYGEELPMCKERNESCWAKNRRAHFVVRAAPTS